MKANLYSLDGKILKEISLPQFFSEAVRDDLIKRAVLSDESREYQPKGAYRWAGLETSAKYRGRKEMYGAVKNKGIPHLPHEVQPKGQFGKVKRVPHAVKGRRAHPPKPEKILVEEINKKEYLKALRSALSASKNKIIVENSFENLKKTKDVLNVFESLKFGDAVSRAKENGTKAPVVILVSASAIKAARNLAGVDAVLASELRVKHLAHGCKPGRSVIFTENSLRELEKIIKGEAS